MYSMKQATEEASKPRSDMPTSSRIESQARIRDCIAILVKMVTRERKKPWKYRKVCVHLPLKGPKIRDEEEAVRD